MTARRPLWCPSGRASILVTPTFSRRPRGTFLRRGVLSTCPGTLFVRRARTTPPLLLTDSVGGMAREGTQRSRSPRVAGMHGAPSIGAATGLPVLYRPRIRRESRVQGSVTSGRQVDSAKRTVGCPTGFCFLACCLHRIGSAPIGWGFLLSRFLQPGRSFSVYFNPVQAECNSGRLIIAESRGTVMARPRIKDHQHGDILNR